MLHFIQKLQIMTIDCMLRMNHVPHSQEGKLGYYFQSGTCLEATHVLLSFLWSIICKLNVINVTLQHLKIATQKYKTNGTFLIVLMKLFELYMFQLDININCRHLWYVFLFVRVTCVTFYEMHILKI